MDGCHAIDTVLRLILHFLNPTGLKDSNNLNQKASQLEEFFLVLLLL